MRFCECGSPVFSTDKLTKIGYCKNCSYKRTDTDKRSIIQKAIEKNKREKRAVRTLPHISDSEMEQLSSRNNLISELDFVFSRYIRIRDADANGIVKCYTCPTKKHWSMVDCGHFKKRSNSGLRWHPKNSRPQCKHCNQYLDGSEEIYRLELEKEEKGLPDLLDEMSRERCLMGADELTQLLIDLRSKLRIVESKLIKK